MADKKISQLTGATTPLAGTEVLPIVQGGSTVKVSADDITKGRKVNATSVDLSVGNNSASDLVAVKATNAGENGAYFEVANSSAALGRVVITKEGTGAGADDGKMVFQLATNASLGDIVTLAQGGNATLNKGNLVVATADLGVINPTGSSSVKFPATNGVYFSTASTERGRFTTGGFFKASDAGTYEGSSATYHELRSSISDEYLARITHTAATLPYGILLKYTAASPNDTSSPFLICVDSTTTRAAIRSNGGLANFQSNNADLSDARTKTDINPAGSMWNKIAALEIVTYKYNDQTHDDVNVGVIAQQVETVDPVWVDNDGFGDEEPPDGIPLKTVYTKDITFAAIKALQEAMARIETLESKIAALEEK